ncbi:MarR family winged helix-turn-helix transcriptional regulator [Sphaerisporangium corydalis]|uniref:MarR family winged helix-turn-helix transcriptional regulator n=1 Tax=Sphaerisporangium corydalis TaxID=1441875 RepID=A0ABV9EL24_9ACTN|nr:MarR family transcriptional regulator [Sphaerisporangium corydalis]
MASKESCGELLVRLSDMGTVIKAVKRDLPFVGPRTGLALLVALHRCGELRMGELADLFDVDQSVISRHVADLEERGWVERVPNPRDGRSWYVRLTSDGRQVTEKSLARVRDLLASTLDDWTDEEIINLAGLLARLRDSFDAHRDRAAAHHSRMPRTAPPPPPTPAVSAVQAPEVTTAAGAAQVVRGIR